MCLTHYADTYYKERQNASQSQVGVNVGMSPMGTPNVGMQAANSDYNKNVNAGSSSDLRSCDSIGMSYFQYKQSQLYADAMKSTGLANADAMKSTGLANADANKSVGLANASAMQTVGLANSKTQLYTGLAGAAGGVLSSLFTSGNQKAAVQAQADAEVQKARILAQVELEKAKMQYELMRGVQPQSISSAFPSPSYQQPAYPQPAYQQPAYQQPQYPQPTYQQPPYQQPSYPQASYPPATYQQTQPDYPQSTYQQASLNRSAAPAQNKQNAGTVDPRKYLQSLRLLEDPNCQPGGIVILTQRAGRVCAFASSFVPPGTYTFDGTKLVKY